MPPFPPLQPLPQQIVTKYVIELNTDQPDSRVSTGFPTSMNRPASLSFSSTISTTSTAESSVTPSIFSAHVRTASASLSSFHEPPDFPALPDQSNGDSSPVPMPFKRFMLDGSLSESEIAAPPRSLFPLEQLQSLSERSLAMHLYRSYQSVLACQEAMWEELDDRIRNRKEELLPFGWSDDEELEELQNRTKFERLVERYRS
jgi:hypothetical protein